MTQIPRERFDAHARTGSISGMIEVFNLVYDQYSNLLNNSREVKPKPLTDFSTPPEVKHPTDPTYAVVANGQLWQWNCGWRQYNPRTRTFFGPTLGHLAFRRKPLCKPTDSEWLSNMDRPFGPWRRLLDTPLYSHPQWGHVHLLATDGVHAIVELPETTIRKNVHFTNLTELRQRQCSINSVNKTDKEKKVRKSKLVIEGVKFAAPASGETAEEKMKRLMELF